jgi:hypothetical protein
LTRSPEDPLAAFARCESRMLPFCPSKSGMLNIERREPIPDDIFDAAKNAISLDDLRTI